MKNYKQATDIIKDIKKKIYKPIYFLCGEESFYIDQISSFISNNILEEGERDFNQTIFYGSQVNVRQIDAEVRKYPMMSSHRVVIVKEAEKINKLEELAFYFEKPSPTTILVLNYHKKADKRKKYLKNIQSSGLVFEVNKMYDSNLPTWINEYLNRKGYSATPVAIQMLANSLGNDLQKITSELEKLFIAIEGTEQKIITEQMIDEHIGISKDFNVFELVNAVVSKNPYKSQMIINYFVSQSPSANFIHSIAVLYNHFSKILMYHYFDNKSNREAVASMLSVNKFFVDDYIKGARNYSAQKVVNVISILREYDAKFKGVNNASTSTPELFKEMVYKIIN